MTAQTPRIVPARYQQPNYMGLAMEILPSSPIMLCKSAVVPVFFFVSRHHHDYLNFVTRTFSHPNLSLGFPIISIRTAATTVKHDAAVEAALAAAASSVVVDAAEGHGASIEATAAAIAAASAAAATDAGEFYQTSSCCLSWVP